MARIYGGLSRGWEALRGIFAAHFILPASVGCFIVVMERQGGAMVLNWAESGKADGMRANLCEAISSEFSPSSCVTCLQDARALRRPKRLLEILQPNTLVFMTLSQGPREVGKVLVVVSDQPKI